jgi:peptidoglycan LD-endopeptidase CwlK
VSDTSRDPSLLEPQLRERWLFMQRKWADLYPGLPTPFLTCTHRGQEDQERAFREGRSKAHFGHSLHNFLPAYAFDIAFRGPLGLDWTMNLFKLMADIGEPLGLEWGGRWKDLVDGPHFQLPMTWQQARDGLVPKLPLLPGSVPVPPVPSPRDIDEPWKLVLFDGHEERVVIIPESPNVATRYDAARKRVYVTIQRGDA